jgi:hypothetical protein
MLDVQESFERWALGEDFPHDSRLYQVRTMEDLKRFGFGEDLLAIHPGRLSDFAFNVWPDGRSASLVKRSGGACYGVGSGPAPADLNRTCSPSGEVSCPPRRWVNFPRFWICFSYVLSARTREKVFEPAYNELLDDYLSTWKERSKWARRWLMIAYTWRTFVMVVDCLAAASRDRAFRLVSGFLPDWAREWFGRIG